MFEMIPQSSMDIYYSKLQYGDIKTAMVSTNDEKVDKETETDDFDQVHKFNQAPEDLVYNFNRNKDTYQRKIKRQNEALQLNKFMEKAGPMMIKVIEENKLIYFQLHGKDFAAKGNAVQLKQTINFPEELLFLFSDKDGKPAELIKIDCIHMFESSPQNKMAVAYSVKKASGEVIYLTVVYLVTSTRAEKFAILQCDQEVTQMCTSGSPDVLLMATRLGSLVLYDLKSDIESDIQASSQLNFENLLRNTLKNWDEFSDHDKIKHIQHVSVQFQIMNHSFMCDSLKNYPHYAPIKSL